MMGKLYIVLLFRDLAGSPGLSGILTSAASRSGRTENQPDFESFTLISPTEVDLLEELQR